MVARSSQGARRIDQPSWNAAVRWCAEEAFWPSAFAPGVMGALTALVVFAAGALLAWLLVRSITPPRPA